MERMLFGAGALLGLTAVAMAAAASHAFSALPACHLQLIRVALQIHGWHALALLVTALWWPRGGRCTEVAGGCFLAGTVVFCGAVYGVGLGWFHVPLAAPVGGFVLMGGWAALLVGVSRKSFFFEKKNQKTFTR